MAHNQDMKFTVVIPTKERCDTLKWALKTCVTQNYDNLEIIVSDNFSQDNTREVVESFQDKRIKYVNTNKPLNMTDNWEFALSHVSEGYVTIIGDDDGILLDSIKDAAEVLEEWGFPTALAWQRVRYHWNNFSVESTRNQIRLPLGKRLYLRNSKEELRKLSEFIEYDTMILPNIYNSFVKHEILQTIKKKSGRYFCSSNPDIYSGFAVAAVTENYLFSEKPFGVAGLSSHSNGIAFLKAESQAKIAERVEAENIFPFHHKIALSLCSPFYIAESVLQAVDNNLLPIDYPISIKQALETALITAKVSPPLLYENIVAGVRETAERNSLKEWAEKVISKTPNSPIIDKDMPAFSYDAWSNSIYWKVNPVEVQNVYDAALLIKQIIRLNDFGMIGTDKFKYKFNRWLSFINKNLLPTTARSQMRELFLPALRQAGIIRG